MMSLVLIFASVLLFQLVIWGISYPVGMVFYDFVCLLFIVGSYALGVFLSWFFMLKRGSFMRRSLSIALSLAMGAVLSLALAYEYGSSHLAMNFGQASATILVSALTVINLVILIAVRILFSVGSRRD